MPAIPKLAALAAVIATSFLSSACSSCSGLGPGAMRRISIVSYNAMNLFDATDQGGEYPEFSVRGGAWDESRYHLRLARLAEAVAPPELGNKGPDLLCLLEIENAGVLEALRNGPLKKAGYTTAIMASTKGSPISSAILTRLPVRGVRAHALASEPGSAVRPGRNILEAELAVDAGELVVLLCHWKSKLEGAAPTEQARREAAALVGGIVSQRTAEGHGAVVVCGDFNESPDEYPRVGRLYPTALMPALEAGAGAGLPRLLVSTDRESSGSPTGEAVLYSPWGESRGFSYAYAGVRERIDGFLLSPGLLVGPEAAQGAGSRLRYSSFSVLDSAFLLDKEGRPLPWSSSSSTGYSDHLPICLVLESGLAAGLAREAALRVAQRGPAYLAVRLKTPSQSGGGGDFLYLAMRSR